MMKHFRIVLNPKVLMSWCRTWRTIPVVSWIIAAHYFRQRNFRLARKYYEMGFKKHSSHRAYPCALLDYSYCLYRLGNWEGACRELQLLTSTRNCLRDAYLLLAEIELLLGKPLSAAQTLERCLGVYARDVQATVKFVEAVTESRGPRDRLKEARSRLDVLSATTDLNDPVRVVVDAAVARYELHCGDKEIGQRLLSRVIATGEAPREALVLRAELLLEQGKVALARTRLERLMQHIANDPKVSCLLAKTYLVKGDCRAPHWALQLAIQACQQSFWQNSKPLQVLVDAYELSGDETSALLILEKMKELPSLQEVNVPTLEKLDAQLERLKVLKPQTQSAVQNEIQ